MLATSRPASVKLEGSKIPQIEHPLSKMAKEHSMEVALNPFSVDSTDGRPVAFENGNRYKSKRASGSRASSRSSRSETAMDGVNLQGTFLTNIPESIAIVDGDANTTRLPLFGNRTAIQPRSSLQSRHGSVKESEKISTAEISDRFEKKLSTSYYEVRKKFLDNDPDRNGNVHREALMRIIQLTTGCEITAGCLNSLLQTWGLKLDKQMFSFTEINAIFMNKSKDKSEGSFIDPINRQQTKPIEPAKMAASDVYELLKDKFRTRAMYLSDLFPESVDSQKFTFNKNDLKISLNKILIDLIPLEMDKLWLKFDPTKQGSIDGMKFLKQMGIISQPANSLTPRTKLTADQLKIRGSVDSLDQMLKLKLREGYTSLGHDFQNKDSNNTGIISIADFLQVLSDHNLNLEESQLGQFLSRCIITPSKEGIPYKEFLIRFQDRSEAGITHKLLTNRDKKNLSNSENQINPIALVEMKLINLFQKDFLELLENFRKLDKYENDSIELKDFRKVLEKKLSMQFTDDQFKLIMDNLPLNRNLTVPYLDFLKQFDTGNFSPLSFTSPAEMSQEASKPESAMEMSFEDSHSGKSIKEIKNIIKEIVNSRFSEMEKVFNELDEYNSKVLTPESMYQLMKRMEIKPELTRGDIRMVWKTFILNERQLLDFKEFTRHFMYNKLTASFPNAKLFPPVKGDSDLMQRSKTLNAATDILLDNLRSKIDIMSNELYKEFIHVDKEGSGEVSIEYFQEVLKELSIELTAYEIQLVCEKFKASNNKILYMELLRPFLNQRKQNRGDLTSLGNRTPTKFNDSFQASDHNESIRLLQRKLQVLNQASTKKNIRKTDSSNSGSIPISELKVVLSSHGISLNEEEIFNLMSRYDKNLTGCINYKLLFQELQSNN